LALLIGVAVIAPGRPRRGGNPIRIPPIAVAGLIALAACGPTPEPARPTVAVSVEPLAYFVERIAGDLVRIEVMVPPGASPTTHEPAVGQLRSAGEAELYVMVGHQHFPFERTWLEPLLSAGREIDVVDASRGVPCSAEDPHVWTSPACVRVIARGIGDALAVLLPERQEELKRRLEIFQREIDSVDAEVQEILGAYRGRSFLVFHPAWGCFAEQYGLEQIAIEHGDKAPGPGLLAEIIRWAREENVGVLFVQPQFPQRSAEQVAQEIGASVVSADPLARNWPDSLRGFARALALSFAEEI